jgi:uncharacterized protein (DUF2126 family)
MDPTSGLLAGEGHIPLVCTPTASQAAPIGGTSEPAKVEFSHSIEIRRLNDPRRLSKPFTDQDWLRIRQVAHGVDEELKAQDVRLTMGGEPTYVGIDDPESPQWNIDAAGSMKRTRGLALIQGLREGMASGGLLHYGQGKWYPGEAVPRWALSCYWRVDGVPVWEDIGLIAREDREYGFRAADALRFIEALTRRLQVSSENLLPAYNPDSETSGAGRLHTASSPPAAGRTTALVESVVVPSPRNPCYLSVGDSPIGFRIPTESMPWVAPDEIEYEFDAAPFEKWVKLPAHPARRMELFAIPGAGSAARCLACVR